MTGWPGRLNSFSAFLIDLNALVEDSADARFQASALAAAARVVPFDSALWAVGAGTAEGPLVHGVELLNQPPQMMADWERIKHLDTLFQAAFARSGEVIVATGDGPADGPPFDPLIQAHTRRYGMREIISTILLDPPSRLFTAISLYRAHAGYSFSEVDVHVARHVFTHLTLAWTRRRLRSVSAGMSTSSPGAIALADSHGVLHVASPAFLSALHAEWPDWAGPVLPPALQPLKDSTYSGRNVVGTATRQGIMVRHELRPRAPIDDLSKREFEVARLVASGLDYRDIAARLKLAPETVRNHLKSIYRKTGAHSRTQLAIMVARTEP
jgi:DNA-binding CsgD family transcriptional regulator